MVANAVNEFWILLLGVKKPENLEYVRRKIHAERKEGRFSWNRLDQNDKAWFEELLDDEGVIYNDGKSDGNDNDDENYSDTSNRLELFLEISQNSQENTCARVSAGLSLWHSCFPVNLAKFLRIPFFTEHLRWLLLKWKYFHSWGVNVIYIT